MTKKPFSRVGDRSWRPKSRFPASASVPSPLCYTGGGRPPSKGLDFVRPFSRSADLERARLCPRLIKWFLRPSGSKRPFGVERDMLFILSGFLFYGVREKRRAEPSAVAFGAALPVGAVRAGVRRARGISDGSENRPLIRRTQSAGLFAFNPTLSPSLSKQRLDDRSICSYRYQAHA